MHIIHHQIYQIGSKGCSWSWMHRPHFEWVNLVIMWQGSFDMSFNFDVYRKITDILFFPIYFFYFICLILFIFDNIHQCTYLTLLKSTFNQTTQSTCPWPKAKCHFRRLVIYRSIRCFGSWPHIGPDNECSKHGTYLYTQQQVDGLWSIV